MCVSQWAHNYVGTPSKFSLQKRNDLISMLFQRHVPDGIFVHFTLIFYYLFDIFVILTRNVCKKHFILVMDTSK